MLILGWILAAVGVLGLYESAHWANSNDDRPATFMLGAVLVLLGYLALKAAQGL